MADDVDALLALKPQTLNENFFVCTTVEQLIGATYLDFQWKKISVLHPSIGFLSNLLELNLSKNELVSIPESISGLQSLICWILDTNKLTELPVTISKLVNLTYMSLHDNHLSALPDAFQDMTNLSVLNLSRNQIISLPQSISCLVGLQDLLLSNNKLTVLPFGVSCLTNLTGLSVQHNQLSLLPYTIGQMTALREFILGSPSAPHEQPPNYIIKLPLSIANLTNLERLEISGLPLEFPKSEIVQLGTKGMMNFIAKFSKEENTLNYIRLIFIGDEKAGKTTIINNLVLNTIRFDSQCRPDYIPTNSVEVCRESYYFHHEGDHISAFIWDFPGDQINRVYYPYFFSSESLMIFTWDASTEPNASSLSDWASMFSMFAVGAPIIVVGTKIDLVSREDSHILEARLETVKNIFSSFQYSLNVIDYIFLSNLTGEHLFKLRMMMSRYAFHSITSGRLYPNYFLQYSRIADGFTRFQPTPIATIHEMERNLAMFQSNISLPDCLEKLHDLGMLVWVDQEHLRDTVYCHAPYLIRIFSQIFYSGRSKSDMGYYPTEELLSKLEDVFPGYSELVISIFRRFQLSFPNVLGQYEIFPYLLVEGTPHPSIWSWNPSSSNHSYCTCELEFNNMPNIAYASLLCRLYPVLHRDYSSLVGVTHEYLSSNMFVFTISANRRAPNEPTYQACLVRSTPQNRLFISVRSTDAKYPSFECMKHLTNLITRSLSYFKNVLLQSRRLVCPSCSLTEPNFESCGRVTLDGINVGEEEKLTCVKENRAFKVDEWMEGLSNRRQRSAPTNQPSRDRSISEGSLAAPEDIAEHARLYVPSLLQIESSSTENSRDSAVIFHIMCDRPEGPHRCAASAGIRVPCAVIQSQPKVLEFFLRLWKPKMSEGKLDEYRNVSEADLATWLVQKGAHPFRVPLSPSYVEVLALIDPQAEWRLHLQSSPLHDNHPRYLCKHCNFLAQQGWSSYITHTSTSLSGYMLYRHEAFYKLWERRFFVLDHENKALVRYHDATKSYQSGVIRLDGHFEIGAHSFGDDMAGFYIHVGKTKYQFKAKTATERDAWLVNIQKCR